MKIRAVQWLASVACSLILMTAAAPADAGIIPGIWNALFGPCGGGGCAPSYCGPTSSYYGPSYYGSCGPAPCGPSACSTGGCGTTQSYYGWSNSGYACAPSCGPCSIPCSPGASGNCSIAPDAVPPGGSIKPVPEDAWKKRQTYENGAAPPNSSDATPPATRTLPEERTEPETGLPSGRPRPKTLNEDTEETKAGALRIPGAEATTPEGKLEVIEPHNPADGKKAPAPKKVPLNDDKDATRVSPINLDEKVAWRPTAERKRLELEPSRGNARLIRIPLYAKSEWQPVEAKTSVAKR